MQWYNDEVCFIVLIKLICQVFDQEITYEKRHAMANYVRGTQWQICEKHAMA